MGKKASPSPAPVAQEEEPPAKEPEPEIFSGEFEFQDGSMYKGDYCKKGDNICLHGKGCLLSGPELFEGLFDNGRHNDGTYTSCSGAVYSGTFKNNVFHGFGTYTWPKGGDGTHRVYQGSWRDGLMHGRGQFQNFSYGFDKLITGFSIRGRFSSNVDEQEEAKRSFIADYGDPYVSSAKKALLDLAAKTTPEGLPHEYLVNPPVQDGDEVAEDIGGSPVEDLVLGPYPDALAVSMTTIQGFAASLTEEAEKPVQIAVMEDRTQVGSFDGTRIRKEQLQHVGQCVEFKADGTPGSICAIVFVNISSEYDSKNPAWKLVHCEVVPYPAGGPAPPSPDPPSKNKKGK